MNVFVLGRASLGADMLQWLLDHFWLSLYIGLSQAIFVNYAAKNHRRLGILGSIFLLIFSPLWPVILVIMLLTKR